MQDESELPREVGATAEDIRTFIVRFQASYGGNEIDEFRAVQCRCGSDTFFFCYCPDGGASQRLCPVCDLSHLMCDSANYWEPEEVTDWDCRECRGARCNLGVGFALSKDREFIRWLYIAQRCVKCGLLDLCTSWKIMYGPSLQLMDQV
jgi:hypothetical protein